MGKGKRKLRVSTDARVPPAKDSNVLQTVRQLVENGVIARTGHAKERLDKREVTIQEVRSILASGKRNAAKDEYSWEDAKGNSTNRWSYAFEGKTKDDTRQVRSLRVCVSIIRDGSTKIMLLITVIDLKGGRKK